MTTEKDKCQDAIDEMYEIAKYIQKKAESSNYWAPPTMRDALKLAAQLMLIEQLKATGK